MEIIDIHCHVQPMADDKLLRAMDKNDIGRAWICPDRPFIAVNNRQGNIYVANAVKAHPDRFCGFAVANPWLGDKKVREMLRYSRDIGLSGLKINTKLQGLTLIDEMLFPLIELAEEFDWPVYCHTGTPVTAMPLQLAELALQYPNVCFIMGHGGFSDFWYDVSDALERCPNMYLETSYISPSQIMNIIDRNGIERILFGSDWPFSDISLELKKIDLLKINDRQRQIILSENAENLTLPALGTKI